jgi:hypothetical protein
MIMMPVAAAAGRARGRMALAIWAAAQARARAWWQARLAHVLRAIVTCQCARALARLREHGAAIRARGLLCTALRLPVLRIEARRAPEWSQLIEMPDRSESGRSVSRLPLGAGTGPTALR